MSHNPYHDPTPTPTSKPDDAELDGLGTMYSENFETGHIEGFARAQELEPGVSGGSLGPVVAAAASHGASASVPPYNGDPTRSGYRDGYRVGYLRGIYNLSARFPAQAKLLEAAEAAFLAS